MKNFFNKTILLNYSIQIIVPLIFTIVFILMNGQKLEYNALVLSYVNTNSFGLWLIFGNIERIYFDLLIMFFIKYIFVVFYANIFKNNQKVIFSISIITSVLGSIVLYPIVTKFMLRV
ncbi:hypothetical protein DLH72_01875 [Candidatus Gracilibacteria bacterium]|nr:MAG: hypothetical protein DLH72_01875 [Candidatus Gracilibacteria bacterium]